MSRLGIVAFVLLAVAVGIHHAPDGLVERIFLGIELSWLGTAAWHCATWSEAAPGQPRDQRQF